MPIDKEGLLLKLKQMEEYISDVKRLRSRPKSDFVERSDTEILAERHIEKACQAGLDIANHIIAETDLGAPTMYRDLGYILAKAGIISNALAQKMENIAKFRNRLVHEYANLNPDMIYQIVQKDIDDLTDLATQIYAYIQTSSHTPAK